MNNGGLTFEPLGHGGDLPSNFLPSALPFLLDPVDDGRRMSIFGTDGDGGLRVLDADVADIVAPERLSDLTRMLMSGDDAPVFFGPIAFRPLRDDAPRTLPLPKGRLRRAEDAVSAEAPVEVGVIDAGLACWAPMFGQAFASLGFLDLDGMNDPFVVKRVPAAELARMRDRGGSDAGDRANRADLAAAHPGSVYATPRGAAPIASPGGLSHGTAVASLVLEAAPESRLHGLELPRSVLLDASGSALRGVLDVAVRGVVDLAAADHDPERSLRVVIVLAFGFLGGPQDGFTETDVLRRLRQTIAAYGAIGIEVTLVVPMGNHLQDRAHAVLSAIDGAPCRLDWRVLPDDHSGNTVDLFHADGIPALTVEAPDGRCATRPAGSASTHILCGARGAFGATWTTPVGGGVSRTRISLAPTASRVSVRALAPFGRWRLSLDSPAADAWILRDDSAHDDRATPRRRSWFEDPHYRDRDGTGLPGADDVLHPKSLVRRSGTASALAASLDAAIVPVGARWAPPGGAEPQPARYCGSFTALHPRSPDWVVVETRGPAGGRLTRGNAAGRQFRLSGSSVAAAIHAGLLAGRPGP